MARKHSLVCFTYALLAFFLFCAVPLTAEETPQDLISHSIDNLPGVVFAPWHASVSDYALAAAWGGVLAMALKNDRPWADAVYQSKNQWQDTVMPPVTWLGEGWVHVVGSGILYLAGNRREKDVAIIAMEGQVGVAIFSRVLKLAASATRPGSTLDGERDWLTGVYLNDSFPSGHSTTAFCAAVIFGDAYNIEWLTYPLAGLISYSRVYNHNHWPADIWAGAGLGFLIGQVVVAYHRNLPGSGTPQVSLIDGTQGSYLAFSWNF